MPNGRPLTSGDGDNTIVIDTVPIVTSEVNKAVPSIVGLKNQDDDDRQIVLFTFYETLHIWWFIMSVLLLFIASIN